MTIFKVITKSLNYKKENHYKTVLHKKGWMYRSVQMYMEKNPMPLTKSNIGMKLYKHYVKINLCRNPKL